MIDEYLTYLLDLIDKHGWAIQNVMGGELPGEVPFSYTVGLTTMGHPELIMKGMPHPYAPSYLNALGGLIRDGRRYQPNTTTTDVTGPTAPMALIEVVDTSDLLAVANFYGEVDALQVIWPDSKGRLPWHSGYANPPDAQPILGVLPEKFDA
jgi:hypothetical protein